MISQNSKFAKSKTKIMPLRAANQNFAFCISHFAFERKRRGFTLIEMLVVVAVAAMILSGVLVSLQQSRAKARDATREQHIKTLQNALALHANLMGSYPVYDGLLTGSDTASTQLKSSDSLPQMPLDPLNSGTYRYSYASSDGSTYTLTYYLETNTIPGKSAGANTAGP